MLQHGTVAVFSMIGIWCFLGFKHIMIAYPIALTSAVLTRQNLRIKTLNKITRIVIIDIILITLAHIATINFILCISVNALTIFFIAYTITSSYDPTFYRPFLMIFIFVQGVPINLNELPLRILAIFWGIFILIIGEFFINKVNVKSQLNNSIYSAVGFIDNQLSNISKGHYDENISKKCINVLKELGYKIYTTRYGNKLTTNLGKVQFNIYIILEHLNIYLYEFYQNFNGNEHIPNMFIMDLREQLKNIPLYSSSKISLNNLNNREIIFEEKYKDLSNRFSCVTELIEVIRNLKININDLSELDNNHLNKIYDQWERSSMDKFKNLFKEHLTLRSLRFNFALRISITLTIALCASRILGFFKIIWVIVTILSVMQPYYEETIWRSKGRIKGNILALIIVVMLLNIIENKYFTRIILIIALYFIYAFKDYYKISICTATASLCISSLATDVNVLSIYRLAYVFLGVIVITFANRFIFPYRIRKGVEVLIDKIISYNELFLRECIIYINGIRDVKGIRDVVIHQCLMSKKLQMKNRELKDKNIEKIMYINNKFTIDLAYTLLIKEGEELFTKDIFKRVINTSKIYIKELKYFRNLYDVELVLNKEKLLK